MTLECGTVESGVVCSAEGMCQCGEEYYTDSFGRCQSSKYTKSHILHEPLGPLLQKHLVQVY